jgi:isopenicillin N synthase-like dioxygenase
MTTTAVPIIDIDPFLKGSETGRRTDAERVGRACEEIGFLIVVGHGVPAALVAGMCAGPLPRSPRARR